MSRIRRPAAKPPRPSTCGDAVPRMNARLPLMRAIRAPLNPLAMRDFIRGWRPSPTASITPPPRSGRSRAREHRPHRDDVVGEGEDAHAHGEAPLVGAAREDLVGEIVLPEEAEDGRRVGRRHVLRQALECVAHRHVPPDDVGEELLAGGDAAGALVLVGVEGGRGFAARSSSQTTPGEPIEPVRKSSTRRCSAPSAETSAVARSEGGGGRGRAAGSGVTRRRSAGSIAFP